MDTQDLPEIGDTTATLWHGPGVPEDTHDKILHVYFYLHPRLNTAKTYGQKEERNQFGQIIKEGIPPAGRPIFDDVEYIHIAAPGEKLNIIERKARRTDKLRFPKQYAAFKNGQKDVTSGTPLSRWPLISRSQVEELKFFNVFTVEQLAGMPDGNIQNVGNISHLKKQAQDFLDLAKGTAPTVALRAENEAMRAQMEALQRQIQEQALLVARLSGQAAHAEQPAAAPKRRGRPKKVEAVENADV